MFAFREQFFSQSSMCVSSCTIVNRFEVNYSPLPGRTGMSARENSNTNTAFKCRNLGLGLWNQQLNSRENYFLNGFWCLCKHNFILTLLWQFYYVHLLIFFSHTDFMGVSGRAIMLSVCLLFFVFPNFPILALAVLAYKGNPLSWPSSEGISIRGFFDL